MRRLDLYLQHDRPVGPVELERYRDAVRRRLRREPLQYILGTVSFRHLELMVDARVLIPRPETEVLVGAVLDWTAERERDGRAFTTVVDIGTGSGAIALSLAAEGGFERVVATDVSQDALTVAAENAARCGLADRVEFRLGSLFETVLPDERFGVVVSNPPYVAEADRHTLAEEVREHEPGLALFAGAGGLDVVQELIASAPAWLEAGGLLALEIGLGQADRVLELVRRRREFAGERIVQDLTGRPRFLLAERVTN